MSPVKPQQFIKFFWFIASGWWVLSACAGNSPRPVPVGPVPSANGAPASGDAGAKPGFNKPSTFQPDSDPLSNDAGTRSLDATSATPAKPAQQQMPATGPGTAPPPPPATTAPVVTTPAPAKCTAFYALGYGDPYQSNGTGPWLAKNKEDFTEPCLIGAPACTAMEGNGYGTKFPHGKLWLAKLTDANKGMEDVCIITKLTGTSG